MNIHTRINMGLLILIPVCLITGHVNDGALNWKVNQISTYAAQAPHDNWITAGMVFSVLALLSMGTVVQNLIPNRWIGTCISHMYGMSAGGLLLLTIFEEKVSGFKNLGNNGVASYKQGFHDGGLILFFIGTAISIALTGCVLTYSERGWRRWGSSVLLLFPIGAWFSREMIIQSGQVGLYQRAAFLCFWCAYCLLMILQKNQLSSNS